MGYFFKNKIRLIFTAAMVVVAALSLCGFVACSVDDVEAVSVTPDEIAIRIGEFDYDDYEVVATYTSGKTERLKLTENMLSAADRVNLFVEGDHDITVTYQQKTTIIKVNVRRNVFAGATFDDLDVVYTGEFYTVEVQNVPEGTTVTYPTTNRFRNAGEYEATAILRKDAFEMKEMKAKINIRKADYDLSGTVFADKTESYDGNEHSLCIEGDIPAGLYIDYTITREGGREENGNSARNAGVYTVHAVFSGDVYNFNKIEPKDALLTIEQAEIDLSGVKFEDKTEFYDRTRHTLTIEGALPVGVSVAYENNEHVDAGEYVAKAKFIVADSVNFAPIPERTAVLTVLKTDYDMSAVHFDSLRYTYDGEEKRVEIQGTLPVGVTVAYENNVGVNAGTYQARATFSGSDKNYNDPAPMTTALVIDPAQAPMDSIVFLRTRFISMSREFIDFDYSDPDDWDDPDEYEKLKNYDPYQAAMEYRPLNIPIGLTVNEVKYCKTDGWVEDLTVYIDGEGFTFIDRITEDGYYVVVVTFDSNDNYVSVSPVVTQIRTDTVADFRDNAIFVYDRNASNTDGTYYDFFFGSCTDDDQEVSFGNATYYFCECGIFRDYREGGASDILTVYDPYLPNGQVEAFSALSTAYKSYVLAQQLYSSAIGTMFGQLYATGYQNELAKLLSAATAASVGPDEYSLPVLFDAEKFVAFSVGENSVERESDFGGDDGDSTKEGYAEIIARLLGYSDVSQMLSDVNDVAKLLIANRAGASVDSAAARCVYKGAIYNKIVTGQLTEQVFMLPYKFTWMDPDSSVGEIKQLFAYVFIDDLRPASENDTSVSYPAEVRVLLSDLELANKLIALETGSAAVNVNVYGRCITSENDSWKLSPTKIYVTENGEVVRRTMTSVNDYSLIIGWLDNVEETRYIYKFVTELPGNCSQAADGYNEEDYTIVTDFSIIKYCDCDPFGAIIKNNGGVGGIASRSARDDHAQLSDEMSAYFDSLSARFDAFMSNYNLTEGLNEWKIGVNNHNYSALSDFNDMADAMFFLANRYIWPKNVHTVQDTAIIGMNRQFAISMNGSGVSYSVDGYRTIVMKLFGFEDLTTFTEYSDALSRALCLNEKQSSTEYASLRVLYDGAVYTANGYYVLPFVINSSLTEDPVFAFVFVDGSGNMSVWLNNARNAFNAVNFPMNAEEKTVIEIAGRCTYFEYDGYLMIEEMGDDVIELVDRLKGYNPFDAASYDETIVYIAAESIKSISAAGEYMVFSSYTDTEGFTVCFDCVYDYEHGEYWQSGFYSYITIVSLDDLKAANERLNTDNDDNDNGTDDDNDTDADNDSGND